MWSSAAMSYQLQCSMCCPFRDTLLHILVVITDYLSYRCLPDSLNQLGHSPLTSSIRKTLQIHL